MEQDIEEISKNLTVLEIGAVTKPKPHVHHNTLICAYNALVLSFRLFDTCDRLQKLQKTAAKIITDCINEHEQSEPVLAEFQWKTLSEIRAQFVAVKLYKIIYDLAPKRLSDIFHETPSSRQERGSDLASNTSTATLIFLSANQICRTYPINQSNCLKIGER